MSSSGTASANPSWFTTTHWSLIFQARDAESPRATVALEHLCRIYRKPVFTYIRQRGYSIEDAEDLTQEFFSRLLAKEFLQHLQHRDGKFRSFLLTFVKRFLSDERDKAMAQKRGAGQIAISLEALAEGESAMLNHDAATPDLVFDRQWAHTILERTLERLREEYAAAEKVELFDVIKDLQPYERGATGYAGVAASLGMTESAVKSAVHRMRKRYYETLREEVGNTVSDSSDIDTELQHLMQTLS